MSASVTVSLSVDDLAFGAFAGHLSLNFTPTKGNFENVFNQRSPIIKTRFKVTFWYSCRTTNADAVRQCASSEVGAVCLGGPTYPRLPWGSVTRRSDVPSRKLSQVEAVQCASVGRRALAVCGAVWLGGPTYPHECAPKAKAGQCASVGRRTLASEAEVHQGCAIVRSSPRCN